MSDAVQPLARWDCPTTIPPHPDVGEALRAGFMQAWSDTAGHYPRAAAARLTAEQAQASLVESLTQLLGLRDANWRVVWLPSGDAALPFAIGALAHARRRVGPVALSGIEPRRALHAARSSEAGIREVQVSSTGRLVEADLAGALPGSAGLVVSIANAEAGTSADVEDLANMTRQDGVPLIADADAALGYGLRSPGADAYTLSASALGFPGGPGVVLAAPTSGWLPARVTPQVPPWARLATAVAAQRTLAAATSQVRTSANGAIARIRAQLAQRVADVDLLGEEQHRAPHILTFSALYCDGVRLAGMLAGRGFEVGSGSACAAVDGLPSHVLAHLGRMTGGNIRIGIPPAQAQSALDRAGEFVDVVAAAVHALRSEAGVL